MFILQVIVNGLTIGAFLALIAIGLTLIFSILRVVNFAHGVLFMFGAYTVFYVSGVWGMNYFVGLAAAGVAVGISGYLLDTFLFRRFRGLLLEGAVMAIGVALFLETASWVVFGGAPQGLSTPFPGIFKVGGLIINKHRLFVVIAAMILVAALHAFVRYTRYGRAMRAMQQDDYAARLQGIDVDRISALTFVLGGLLAGLAGGLVAPLQLLLPNMGASPLLLAFVVIILGGMGSVGGALLAALIIGLTQSAITTLWTPQAALGISFLLAMVILLVRPKGLFGHD
jgi:branched-chain amino acid transport system permease protein